MTHRSNGRGSLILDRRFPPPIGRLRLATKLADPAELAVFTDTMLPALEQQGSLEDVLLAIQARRVTVRAALAMWREGRLYEIASAKRVDLLSEAMLAYQREQATGDADKEHVRKLGTTARHIARLAPRYQVKDVVAVLGLLKADLGWSAFNQARVHVQAFMRDTVGTSSPLYAAVKDVKRRKKQKRQRGRPMGVKEVRDGTAKLTPIESDMVWSLCASGMMPEEFWERDGCRWHVEADRVHIAGTKNAKRDRDVPLILPLVRPVMGERAFVKRLKRVFGKDAMIYDTRRTFSRWMAEARVLGVNVKCYMGHSMTITELYQQGEVEDQLLTDAAKFRAYTGLDGAPVRRFGVVS